MLENPKTKDFKISVKQFNALKEEYIISGMEKANADSYTQTQLIVKRSLYWHILNSGYEIDDSEIKTAFDENNKAVLKADDQDFKYFLQGANMEAEDYFKLQTDQYKMNYVIAKYMSEMYSKFKQETIAKNQSDDAWYAWLMPQIEQMVTDEAPTVDGSAWTFDSSTAQTLSILKPKSSNS